MIIMALDHVRDFFHVTAATDSPTNLLTTTPILFFTRWITHFCAPTFVFLAGISAFLQGQKRTKKELSIFLMKRGFWLILVEVLIVTLGWTYSPFYSILILQVIWTIGISMIILGILIWLPANVILTGGLLIIFFHNLLDYAEISRHGRVGILWELAHHGNFTSITLVPNHSALIVYSFLPWTGIMMTGYGMGRLFTGNVDSVIRRKILFVVGFSLILIFILLRLMNNYGDSSPWIRQQNSLFTFLSFINFSKYPPSLDYIAVTIGTAMLSLALLDRVSNNTFSFARVFGRVPFFFYIVHIYFIHALTVIFFLLEKYPAKDIAFQKLPFMFRPDRFGFSLPVVYLIWISVLLILYPVCKKYNQYKSRHTYWWLGYI